jgi:beta-glucanase (GH16 family)
MFVSRLTLVDISVRGNVSGTYRHFFSGGITEIDVLEMLLHDPKTAYMTFHCNSTFHRGGTYVGNELANGGWHTYGVQWTPNIMIWYIDGVARYNLTECVPNMPMYLLTDLAIGGGWPGSPNATTQFPAYMDIDYIRAYKYVTSGGSYITGPGNGLSFSNPVLAPAARFGISNPKVAPETAAPGATITISVTITAGGIGLTNGIVGYTLYNYETNSISIGGQQTTGVTLTAGQSRTFTYTLTLPTTIATGYYRVAYGIWESNWNNVLWINAASVLGVNKIVGSRGEAGWQQTFAADFNGQTSVSPTVWNTFYSFAPTTVNNELQYYAPDAFSFGSNSYLRIAAQQRSNNGKAYTSGLITTRNMFSQTYGYFEIRARFPAGKGLYPSFWLAPLDSSKAASINIFEVLGSDPTRVNMSIWCSAGSSSSYVSSTFTDGNFHTFGLQWTPSILRWYIDGVERWSYSACLPNFPMYLVANMAIGGTKPGSPNATTTFPSYFEIDYIRTYKYVAANGFALSGPNRGIAFSNPSIAAAPLISIVKPVASPATVIRGSTVLLNSTLSIGQPGISNAFFGPRIYRSSDWTDAGGFTDSGVTISAGQTKSFSFAWTIPTTLTPGYYTVSYGAWDVSWNNLFWENSVTLVLVN